MKMGIETGFKNLDKMLGNGFNWPSLVCLGARPAMGKTTLLLDIMKNMEKLKESYIYFCLEQSKKQILDFKQGIEESKIITDNKFRYVDEIIAYIHKYLCDSEIIFIDSLDMLEDSMSFENAYERKKEILLKLKKCCLDKNVTILFTSQLSRKVEERPSHRPMLTDLRDCGGLEDICDTVIFLLRREYYDANDKPGRAEIIIAKNKYGSLGVANFTYDNASNEFNDYIPKNYNEDDDENLKKFSYFFPK